MCRIGGTPAPDPDAKRTVTPVGRILVGLRASRPAPGTTFMRSGRSTCSSRTVAVDADRLDIGVAGDEQVRRTRLRADRRACGAGWAGRGDRAAGARSISSLAVDRATSGTDAAASAIMRTAAIDDGVAGVAFAGERGIVARRPDRLAGRRSGDQLRHPGWPCARGRAAGGLRPDMARRDMATRDMATRDMAAPFSLAPPAGRGSG